VIKTQIKTYFRAFALTLFNIGFDPRKLASLKYLYQYKKDKREWLRQGGKISHSYMILSDYSDSAGTAKGHYFHQDLLVAQLIHNHNPQRHVDVGSRVDGFVAHVASYREIEVVDVRPLAQSVHSNIAFRQGDLMNPQDLGLTDSLSCLHAIEHFGLGRYTDPIDPNGHTRGIDNLINLVSPGGRLYLSFPIGERDEVHFNAHRVFHPTTILRHPGVERNMRLLRFDYVNDNGDLNLRADVNSVGNMKFGCGIYTFEKQS